MSSAKGAARIARRASRPPDRRERWSDDASCFSSATDMEALHLLSLSARRARRLVHHRPASSPSGSDYAAGIGTAYGPSNPVEYARMLKRQTCAQTKRAG